MQGKSLSEELQRADIKGIEIFQMQMADHK